MAAAGKSLLAKQQMRYVAKGPAATTCTLVLWYWALSKWCCMMSLGTDSFTSAWNEESQTPSGYGGGTAVLKETLPFLKAAANLLMRFEDAKIHIDAHAGLPWDASRWNFDLSGGLKGNERTEKSLLEVFDLISAEATHLCFGPVVKRWKKVVWCHDESIAPTWSNDDF